MSYDIDLTDPVTGAVIEFDTPHQMRGGTYRVGGDTRAHLNVTYNYSQYYVAAFGPDGIRTIYGLTGAQSMPVLEKAMLRLGNDVHSNYWQATEGNAKRALAQLLALAKMRPDGIWKGD